MEKSNPLSKFFRTPSVYAKLPSNGKWYPEGGIDLPIGGQIPVYPMTAQDEIMIRTPDALMNGEGLVHVIASCCPNIKTPWEMPVVDVEAMLVAIRIASYGESMTVPHKCSNCGEISDYEVSLPQLMDQYRCPNYGHVSLNGLTIHLKPITLRQKNDVNMSQFEQARLIAMLTDENLSDEIKQERYKVQMKNLYEINLSIISNSTQYITTPDGQTVSEFEFIKEFYDNAGGEYVRKLKSHLEDLRKDYEVKPMHVKCSSCGHEDDFKLEMDYANFFAIGS